MPNRKEPSKFVKGLGPTSKVMETTLLSKEDEKKFKNWGLWSGIRDINHPESNYDYRGYWKTGQRHAPGEHFPDTFKQHGHESFSTESKYSRSPEDGVMWLDENTKFDPKMAVSHEKRKK